MQEMEFYEPKPEITDFDCTKNEVRRISVSQWIL